MLDDNISSDTIICLSQVTMLDIKSMRYLFL